MKKILLLVIFIWTLPNFIYAEVQSLHVGISTGYPPFYFFDDDDQKLFQAVASGEFTISGFQNKGLRRKIENKNTAQISRILKRLRSHGLVKKVANTYKYYLTRFGSKVITMGLKLKQLYIIPQLADLA